MPGKHTAKEKRQAKHVADSERARGVDPKSAESIGWATVTKVKKMKKGPVVDTSNTIRNLGPAASTPQPSKPFYPPGTKVETGKIDLSGAKPAAPSKPFYPPGTKVETGKIDLSGAKPTQVAAKSVAKAGETVVVPTSTREKIRLRHRIGEAAGRRQFDRHVDEGAKKLQSGKKITPHFNVSTDSPSGSFANYHVLKPKSFRVVSLDDYYDAFVKAGQLGHPAGLPKPPLKKFPRQVSDKTVHGPKSPQKDDFSDEAPTVTMKPQGTTEHKQTGPRGDYKAKVGMRAISDEEAFNGVPAGKHKKEGGIREKSLRGQLTALKALATGYGKTSGGGALKGPNRLMLNLDLNRAMETMPQPRNVSKKPAVRLPGVHGRDVELAAKPPPIPKGHGGKGAMSQLKETLAATKAIAAKSEVVVHKSTGDHPMAKTNFNDLFKSELAVPADDVLCACPHCEAPITKSDLEKAHQGAGAVTNISGAKKGKSSARVVDDNPDGGVTRGGSGKGVLSISRGVPGVKKTDEVVGVQNSKGSKTNKAFDDSSSCDSSSDDKDDKDDKAPPFKKDAKKSVTVRGTEWVQWVDDGSDAAIAKSIAEQSLTPHQGTQPLDRNSDLTRLLI